MSDLTRHETRLRVAVGAARVGLWEWDTSTRRVIYSDEWKRQLGYEPHEVSDDFAEWETRLHPEDLPRMQQLIAAFLANPWPNYEAEFRIRHKDGSWRWILAQGDMISGADGVSVCMIGGNIDITEQKRAQLDLYRANRALRMQSDANHALIRLTDEPSLLREVCRIVVQEGGYRMAWIGLADGDKPGRLRPAAQVGFEAGHLESLALDWPGCAGPSAAVQGDFASSVALPLRHGGKTLGALFVYAADAGAFDSQEMVVLGELADDLAFGIGVLRTRAERDQSAAALRETERKLRTLVENFPDFIARFDPTRRLVYLNPSMTEALSAAGTLLGRTPRDIGLSGDPAGDQQLEDGIARALERGSSETTELTLQTAGGARRFEVRHVPEKDEAGRVQSVLSIARDISEVRRAQEELRAQVLMNEAIFSQAVTSVGLLDLEYRFVRVNRSFANIHATTPEALVGRCILDLVPGTAEPMRRSLDETVRSRTPLHVTDWPHRFADQPKRGMTYWDTIVQPIIGRSGDVELVVFSSVEVTERKRAEDSASAREREFRTLADNTPDTIVRWDRELRRVYANPAAGALAGVPSKNLVGHRLGSVYDPRGHPENLESMRIMHEVIRHAFATGEGATVELVWVGPDDRRVYQGRFVPEFASDGSIPTVLGIARDITDLKETQRQFLTLTEHSPDLILRFGRDGRYLHANSAVERATGIPVQELLGRRLGDPIPGRESEPSKHLLDLRLEVEHVVATGLALETEIREPDPAGERIFDVRLVPECDDAGLVTSVLDVSRDITARKRAEEALRASEQRFREVTENIDEVLWLTDPIQKRLVYVSPAYERVWGRTCDSLYANPRSWLESVHPDDRARVSHADPNSPKASFDIEYRIVRPDGTVRWIRDRSFPFADADGRVHRVAGVAQDITSRRQLEEQLRQSQKMEAIGQLAGGIAHDFNNMLVVIQLHASLLAEAESRGKLREGVQQILEAAERAANLTRQLLTFSRRDVRRADEIDLAEVTAGIVALFERLLGEDIALDTCLAPDLPHIKGDPGLLEQLLMNLAVNARDAMPDGGRLVIRLDPVAVDADRAAVHQVDPGLYLCLSVADTGVGIAPEHLPRIFEPFFTTKDVGKGTGLGLATVFGIVKQHRGWIEVTSEVNGGTEFSVYLPAPEMTAARMPAVAAPVEPARVDGCETILLVEDDSAVRRLARLVLDRHGYRVLEADCGASALALWSEQTVPIDLLLTDLVMPGGMSGHDLANAMRSRQPDLKVVYTSGYSNDIHRHRIDLEPGRNFLPKPYPAQELAATVRRCLDGADS